MDLGTALQTAIQYETNIRNLYRNAAGRCPDAVGKKIFRVLEREEQGHLDYLEKRQQEWSRSGAVSPAGLQTVIPTRDAIAQSKARLKAKAARVDSGKDLELLDKALQMEKETGAFFRRMVQELDPAGQALFGPFVSIEEGHETIVQAEIDNLRGLGFWFDMREFDLEKV